MDVDEDFELALALSKSKDDGFSEKLDEDLDYAFALSLQSEFDVERRPVVDPAEFNSNQTNSVHKSSTGNVGNRAKVPSSIVDQEWEVLDPAPDIHTLFLQFNAEYFWGALAGVEVCWSTRMTLCAGVCSYEGRAGLCSVRLSQPLLKYRPRRDLVETLLHEMIHAYLFVTHNNKDHDAHGPEFLKHMNRLNERTGTKISVYHSFHDEIDVYRTHWWKCNGPCQHNRPFYGLVKRAMNRVPGPRDPWWAAHQAKCGGIFIKIKEPEKFAEKKGAKRKADGEKSIHDKNSQDKDIRNFLSPNIAKKANIHTFSGLEVDHAHSMSSDVKDKKQLVPFSGKGFKLGTVLTENVKPQNSNPLPRNLFKASVQKPSNARKPAFKVSGASKFPVTNGAVRSKGGHTSTASRSGGSKTIVLNKSPKMKKNTEKVDASTDEKKPSFPGRGHVLGGSSGCDRHKEQMLLTPPAMKQKSIENFFGSKSPSKVKPLTKKKPFDKNMVVIFSSDSEEETQSIETISSNNSLATRETDMNSEELVPCPVCGVGVNTAVINLHLDLCLKSAQ